MIQRRHRANPIVPALKFVIGAAIGLVLGCLMAALLVPAAGEDTRRKLRTMLPIDPRDIETKAISPDGALDLLGSVRSRFQSAVDEARQARQQRERELRARLQQAQRTGRLPD